MPNINSSEFSNALDIALKKAVDTTNSVARETITSLMTTIIDEHPLDTTDPDDVVSKGDWIAAIGHEPSGISRNDPSGEQGKSQITSVLASWKATDSSGINIGNDKKQTIKLEYGLYKHNPSSGRTTAAGFSTQARDGFIRKNLMRVEYFIPANRG